VLEAQDQYAFNAHKRTR